jgi:hypothetical protein
MSRVRPIFFPRNPYLFGDMTWGLMIDEEKRIG